MAESTTTKTAEQTFTIIKHRRNGQSKEVEGTLAYLTDYFGYTLECGNSHNAKISRTPKTVKSLVNGLNRSIGYTQRGSYSRDSYELVEA
jgi:hypothetical protein